MITIMAKLTKIIFLLAVWQFFSILMITVFNWPKEIIWLNLAFLSVFILFADTYHALTLLILSIPFYVVLPNSYFDTLAIWRPLFALLFVVWLFKNYKLKIKNFVWMPWDRVLGYFALIMLIITLIFAKFPWQGIKQLIFFINIFLFYMVLINAVRTREQIYGIIKTATASLAIIITLGYVQLISTFFIDLETFWVYWADNIARIFYGNGFAQVSLYSNSWFSYTGGRELRMFSILPDSQSFAYICVFAIAFALPLTLVVFKKFRNWLWSGLRFASLAIMFSGTRAVWVGLFAPLLMTFWLYVKNLHRFFAKKTFWIFAIMLFFFAISPLINLGLRQVRYAKFEENFVDRAKSIYDLNETSNIGRVLIWKESLRNLAKQPWGVGLDNFITTLSEDNDIKTALEEINVRYNLPQKYITAHSLYLQVLVELGIAGFVALIWFCLRVAKTFYAFLRRDQGQAPEEPLSFFVFASCMVFLWLLAAAVFDVTWFNDRVLMYFFLTLGLNGLIINRFDEIKGDA